jgi:hypothetical protein
MCPQILSPCHKVVHKQWHIHNDIKHLGRLSASPVHLTAYGKLHSFWLSHKMNKFDDQPNLDTKSSFVHKLPLLEITNKR